MKKSIPLFLVIYIISLTGIYAQQKKADYNANNDVLIQRIKVDNEKTISDFTSLYSSQKDQLAIADVVNDTIEAGIAPEGDYMGHTIFSNDGNRVFVSNKITNNITVYDWATQTVITNINVGKTPFDMNITNDYLIVACHFSDEVYIINLSDYSTAAIIETDEQPVVVRVSPDQTTAFVGCDINDKCEVINLETLTKTLSISNFPIALSTFSFITGNNRSSYEYSDFKVSPNGNELIIGDSDDQILFIDVETGNINNTIAGVKANKLVYSGDSTALFAIYPYESTVYKIDIASSAVVDEFDLGTRYVSRSEICANQNGSKVYVPLDANQSAILNFDTEETTTFSSTYSAFWVGVSPDHSTIISGQNKFSILDFESETILDQSIGNTQYIGAVSPVGSNIVGFDPLRNEALFFYDYSNPEDLQYLGEFVSGKAPEGDAPYRVAITPDGTKAVLTNTLSKNVTIINLVDNVVDTIIELPEKSEAIAITADSEWAILGGHDLGTIKFINLTTNEFAASLSTGSRPGLIRISPDQQFAYVANISSNNISVIALDGENSTKITNIPCGTIGVSWAAQGVRSDVQVSPNGQYVLVAASFDDNVKVIDTQSNSVVASLTVEDFPIQIAFNSTGEYAVVSNLFSNSYSILHVDGANSSVVGTFPSSGNSPLRMDYDPVNDQFAILSNANKLIDFINPETGDIENTEYYSSVGSLYQIMINSLGEKFILSGPDSDVPGYLVTETDIITLPASPSFFDYNEENNMVAIVAPGPDYLTVITWDSTTVGIVDIPLTDYSDGELLANYPNPFSLNTTISFNIYETNPVSLFVIDQAGKTIETLIDNEIYKEGSYQINFSAKGLPAGIYYTKLSVGNSVDVDKISIVK